LLRPCRGGKEHEPRPARSTLVIRNERSSAASVRRPFRLLAVAAILRRLNTTNPLQKHFPYVCILFVPLCSSFMWASSMSWLSLRCPSRQVQASGVPQRRASPSAGAGRGGGFGTSTASPEGCGACARSTQSTGVAPHPPLAERACPQSAKYAARLQVQSAARLLPRLWVNVGRPFLAPAHIPPPVQFKGQVPMSPFPSPARSVSSVLALLSSLPLVRLPAGFVFACVVSSSGQLAQLVSLSGQVLHPSAFRLVCQVAGQGGWLVLAPCASVASQSSFF